MTEETQERRCLVFDLGAGSGRAIIASLADGRIVINELHRFSGYEIRLFDGPGWDMEAIRAGIRTGLRLAAEAGGVTSIAVDGWGVDFGITDVSGNLVDDPRTYRHPRGAAGFAALSSLHTMIGARTGVQVLPIISVFHLHQWAKTHAGQLSASHRFLMIADLISFELSGVAASERTLARTSGLLNAGTGAWDEAILAAADLPRHLFGLVVPVGTVLGTLRPELAVDSGLGAVPVIASAAHDTASAAFALAPGPGEAFAIGGSWSIFGVDVPEDFPLDAPVAAGFGLEGGIGGRAILTRSLPGLFLIRRLRDAWEKRCGERVDFPDIAARAAVAVSDLPVLDTGDPLFFDPADMLEAMERFDPAFKELGLGALARALYLGLAKQAAACIDQLSILQGGPIHRIKLGGGAVRDETFCQCLATACGRPVVADLIEASAVGNALIQFMATGVIASLGAARGLVSASFQARVWLP